MELEFNLPTPTAFTIAQPWVLYKGRLFMPGNSLDEAVDNYLELNDTLFGMDEIESPKGLEELYFVKHADQIQQFQQRYMQSAANTEYHTRDSIEQELGRNKVLSMLVTKILPVITSFNENDQLTRMIEEERGISHNGNFIDLMVPDAQRNREARAGQEPSRQEPSRMQREVQRQKQHLIENISRQYAEYELVHVQHQQQQQHDNAVLGLLSQAIESRRPSDRIAPLNDGSILTTHIFPDRNILYYNDIIHELVSTKDWIGYFQEYIDPTFYNSLQSISASTNPDAVYDTIKNNLNKVEKRYLSRLVNKLKSSKLKMEGNYFFPIFLEEDNSAQMQLRYKKLIEKELKVKAVEHNEFQAIQMYEIARQREQISRIAGLERFELNGAGYEMIRGEYYAFVTTPEYALKSPHESGPSNYITFPKAKIGVRIRYDNGASRFVVDSPIVMNKYRHPFLPTSDTMQNICLGTYNASESRRLPADESVMTLLSKSKEILLMGYSANSRPYPSNSLRKGNWSGIRGYDWVTKREVERRGLVCLNEFDN